MSKAQTAPDADMASDEFFAFKKKGRALLRQGEFEKAEAELQKALALEPDAPDILFLLGKAAHSMEQFALALEYYHRSLEFATVSETYNAIADVFINLQQANNVLTIVKKSEDAGAANYDTMVRKAFACILTGDLRTSLYTFMKAIKAQPQSRDARVLITAAIRAGKVPNYNEEFKEALTICMQSDDMEHYGLAQAWLHQVQNDPAGESVRELFDAPDYMSFATLYAHPKNRAYALTPFFRQGMERVIIMTQKFENFLLHVRRFYLETIFSGDELSSEESAFIASLSVYCFLSEHVLKASPEENAILDQVQVYIEEGSNYTFPDELIIYGAYRNLNKLKNAGTIAAKQEYRRHAAGRILALQIDEPKEEKEIKKTIQSLVPIEDSVSKAVQGMYEENPYPRWLSCNRLVPLQDRNHSMKKRKVLIAGCGTGRQVVQMASILEGADITAVDLSSSSLAYSIRKTREYNIDNVTFRQGDILNLGQALEPNSFDRVECTGVLHHMKDPMAGWRVITDLLKPGGIMTLGLYSEFSRRGVVKAREIIAEQNFPPTVEGIQACRDFIFSLPKDNPAAALIQWRDFYTVSDCRDMIFHVQEHRYTIKQIKACLEELGLEFMGFMALKQKQIDTYRARTDDPGPMRDLDLWHTLEEEDNDLFFSIYQFQVKKKSI